MYRGKRIPSAVPSAVVVIAEHSSGDDNCATTPLATREAKKNPERVVVVVVVRLIGERELAFCDVVLMAVTIEDLCNAK
jgi:hypothetical protein